MTSHNCLALSLICVPLPCDSTCFFIQSSVLSEDGDPVSPFSLKLAQGTSTNKEAVLHPPTAAVVSSSSGTSRSSTNDITLSAKKCAVACSSSGGIDDVGGSIVGIVGRSAESSKGSRLGDFDIDFDESERGDAEGDVRSMALTLPTLGVSGLSNISNISDISDNVSSANSTTVTTISSSITVTTISSRSSDRASMREKTNSPISPAPVSITRGNENPRTNASASVSAGIVQSTASRSPVVGVPAKPISKLKYTSKAAQDVSSSCSSTDSNESADLGVHVLACSPPRTLHGTVERSKSGTSPTGSKRALDTVTTPTRNSAHTVGGTGRPSEVVDGASRWIGTGRLSTHEADESESSLITRRRTSAVETTTSCTDSIQSHNQSRGHCTSSSGSNISSSDSISSSRCDSTVLSGHNTSTVVRSEATFSGSSCTTAATALNSITNTAIKGSVPSSTTGTTRRGTTPSTITSAAAKGGRRTGGSSLLMHRPSYLSK